MPGCLGKHKALGLCQLHYDRVKRTGSPLRTRPEKAQWHLDQNGYIRKWKNGTTVFQHREIVKEHLGRDLFPGENVHHKNGNRSDNRLENLELWVSQQPVGQRPQDLVKYAREILEKYGEFREWS